MSMRSRRFYATSVSGTAVLLSPEPGDPAEVAAGTNIQQITVTTSESTADSNFWGTTGSCARFFVKFEKIT